VPSIECPICQEICLSDGQVICAECRAAAMPHEGDPCPACGCTSFWHDWFYCGDGDTDVTSNKIVREVYVCIGCGFVAEDVYDAGDEQPESPWVD
jgi:hypothetical protein